MTIVFNISLYKKKLKHTFDGPSDPIPSHPIKPKIVRIFFYIQGYCLPSRKQGRYTLYCVSWDIRKYLTGPPHTLSETPVFVPPPKIFKWATLKWATHTSRNECSQVKLEGLCRFSIDTLEICPTSFNRGETFFF